MRLRLEAFRLKQRVHQIKEQRDRGHAGDDEIHCPPPFSKPVAGFCEVPTTNEEQNCHRDIKDVEHRIDPLQTSKT
jgi:hypothetical protein